MMDTSSEQPVTRPRQCADHLWRVKKQFSRVLVTVPNQRRKINALFHQVTQLSMLLAVVMLVATKSHFKGFLIWLAIHQRTQLEQPTQKQPHVEQLMPGVSWPSS